MRLANHELAAEADAAAAAARAAAARAAMEYQDFTQCPKHAHAFGHMKHICFHDRPGDGSAGEGADCRLVDGRRGVFGGGGGVETRGVRRSESGVMPSRTRRSEQGSHLEQRCAREPEPEPWFALTPRKLGALLA